MFGVGGLLFYYYYYGYTKLTSCVCVLCKHTATRSGAAQLECCGRCVQRTAAPHSCLTTPCPTHCRPAHANGCPMCVLDQLAPVGCILKN